MAPTQNRGQQPKKPPLTPEQRAERARRAALARWSKKDEHTGLTAREALAVARVEARIADAVEHAPPLPADLSIRLIELIRTAGRCVT